MFRRNLFFSLIAFGSAAFGQMLIMVTIARLYGINGVAEYGLANSVVVPVVMFSSLRLRTILATDAKREFAFYDYLWLRIMLLLVTSAILVSIVFLIAPEKIRFELLLLILLAKIIDSLSELYQGHLQLNETMGVAAFSCAGKMVLSVAGFYFVLYTSGDLIMSYSLVVLVALLFLGFDAFYVLVKKKLVQPKFIAPFNGSKLKKLLMIGLPIGGVAFINSTTAYIPVYIGGILLEESDLGWLVILSFMLAIGVRFFTSFANIYATRVSFLDRDGRHGEIKGLIGQCYRIIIGVTIAIIIFWLLGGRWLLDLVFGQWDEMVFFCAFFVIVASGFNHASLLGRFLMIAMRRSTALIKIYTMDFIVTLILAATLMSIYGIYGAVVSILIARVIRFLLTCRYSADMFVAKS